MDAGVLFGASQDSKWRCGGPWSPIWRGIGPVVPGCAVLRRQRGPTTPQFGEQTEKVVVMVMVVSVLVSIH